MTDLFEQLVRQFAPIIVLLGLLSILAALFRTFVLPRLKGALGEGAINFWIKRRLDPNEYHLLPDIMLPTPDGTTQIDHVLVSRYGIFVIETKMYKGWIYGSEREAKWTQVIYRRKEKFQNPLRQNYKHIKTLSELTGIPESYFKSLIVFVGDSTFKTPMPDNVVRLTDFVRYIRSQKAVIIEDEQVPEVVAAIREWAATVSKDRRAAHISHLRERKKGH